VANWNEFRKTDIGLWQTAPARDVAMRISPVRWDPVPIPSEPLSFLEGVRTLTTAGDAEMCSGMGAHIYTITRSMKDEYFYDADGELLFVPQQGGVHFHTEFGIIDAEPGEIAIIPRGVKFRLELRDGPARGYICENYGGALTLPERGPIGANCMANPRDFLTPVAAYEDRDAPSLLYVKWGGALWVTDIEHSPLDVVAWHGNYAPYKYDLRRYSPVGPVLFDHADPSIYTVLTSPSETPGTANMDFVIFSDRWMVAEDTFRPPWYHMNVIRWRSCSRRASRSAFLLLPPRPTRRRRNIISTGGTWRSISIPRGPSARRHLALGERGRAGDWCAHSQSRPP
jgi:homogentisate 1,2-dioxygenase